MEIVDNLNFDVYPELTIDYVFRYVTEEEIFAKYLGIPVKEVIAGNSICNPLRDDNNPGCKFYIGDDNRLRFTDFTGYTCNGRFKSWDCFDTVVNVINMTEQTKVPYYDENKELKYKRLYLDIGPSSGYIKFGGRNYKKSKLCFAIMLKHIAQQFKIHKYSGATTADEIRHIKADKTIFKRKPVFTEFTPRFRDWNNHDLKYWRKYHVDIRNPNHRAVLKYFGANPLYALYISGKLVYEYKSSDVAYSYYEGKDDKNRIHMKAYFPKRSGKVKYKPRFYCNTKRLQGLEQLTPHMFGILQKSKKDIILQRLHYGLTGVAPQGESNVLAKEQWYDIKYNCDLWVSLGDFDYAGVRFGIQHYILYGIEPLFFIRKNTPIRKYIGVNEIHKLAKEFGFKIVKEILSRPIPQYFKGKDFSDNLEILGVNGMRDVILQTMAKYKPAITAINEFYDEKLNWI